MKYSVIHVLITLVFIGCATERDVVVEKQKTPKEEYFETFQQIVADIARGNTEYYKNKRFIIRAEVEQVLGGDVWLATNNKKVLFSIFFQGTRSLKYKEGMNYTFTVRIWFISHVNIPRIGADYYEVSAWNDLD